VADASVTLTSGLRLSYAERGAASEPAVVLLPGPTDAWRSYEPVLDRLPRGTRAIAISARGHGDSDKPDGGYAVADFAGDVVEALAARCEVCFDGGATARGDGVVRQKPGQTTAPHPRFGT